MPLLIAAFATVAGSGTYWYQRRVDHRIEFNREKREVYREYLAAVRKFERWATRSGHPNIKKDRRDALDAYLEAYSQLSIFAPDSVK